MDWLGLGQFSLMKRNFSENNNLVLNTTLIKHIYTG